MPSGVTKQAKVYVPKLGGKKLEVDDIAPAMAVQPDVELPCGQETAPLAKYHWYVVLPNPTGCEENESGTALAEHCDTCCPFTDPDDVVMLKLATPPAQPDVRHPKLGVTKHA